jgi:hypothetical protein
MLVEITAYLGWNNNPAATSWEELISTKRERETTTHRRSQKKSFEILIKKAFPHAITAIFFWAYLTCMELS